MNGTLWRGVAVGALAGLLFGFDDRGWEECYPPARRVFLYLPLMHAEDLAEQALSVAKYAELGIAANLDFAEKHRAVIVRFGRYPTRNAALERVTTPAERRFLDEGGGW